jgi:hypothetical protein
VLQAMLALVDPPSGGVSNLAWVLVTSLVTALLAVCTVGLRWISKMYDDLKACNAARADADDDTLGLLKVLRTQMEKSRGGR